MAFYDFRKEYLKTLPIKQFGRSYDEKSKNVAKALGISKKELDRRESFITSSAKPAPTRNMKNNDGYNAEDWDRYFQQANPSPKPTVKLQSSKLGEFFHKLGKQPIVKDVTTPIKMYGKGVHNLFDGDPNTTFTGAFKAAVNKAESTDRSKVTKELTRGLTRTANSALLGSLDEAYKKTHNGESAVQFQSRKGGGKAADFAYDALGLFAPGAGAYKGAKALKLGAKSVPKLAEGATKGQQLLRIAKQGGQYAKEGAAAGALLGTGQVGTREAINGKDYNWKQNAETIGLNALLGGAGDPLVHGAGAALKGASEKAMKNLLPKDLSKQFADILGPNREVLGLPAPKLELPAPKMTTPKTGNSINIKGTPLLSSPKDVGSLKDTVHSAGYKDVTPETIAKTYNQKQWYHGTGKADLTIDQLDPFHGNHEGLFGHGVYLTDNPKIAEGYANSRGKRTKAPTIYQANVNVNKVLDLEKPAPKEAQSAILKTTQGLDYVYQQETGQPNYFTNKMAEMFQKGHTTEQAIQELRKEITDFSHEAEIPTSHFVENFQDLAVHLKEAGYDGITHTGGGRTGNEAHRVLILLDPHDTYSGTGRAGNITAFNKTDLANKLDNPLPFKKEVLAKKQPLSYVGKLSPKDMVTQKVVRTGHPSLENFIQAVSPAKRESASAVEKISPSSGGKLKEVPTPVNHDVPFNPNDPLPDTTGHIGTKTKKEMPGLAAIKNKAYINTIDNLHPLNEFDKMVEKVTGNKLKPSESAYTLGLNSRGSDQISKQILTSAMVNKNGEVIGKSLKEIASKVPKGKLKEFEDYLINKHAITRQTRGEKVFPDEMKMNAQKSEAKVKEYEQANPKFKELADQYYEYNKQLGKTWLVDTGVLSKEQWDSYLKANPHYTPMHRIFKDIERPSFTNNAKKGFSNQSNPIKKATGSQRKIVSPIESTIEHTDKYVKTAKRNEVMQTFIKNVQKNPEAFKDIAEIVPTKETPQSVLDTLNKDGVDGVLEQFNQGFEQKPDLTKGNVLFGLVDGKKVHVKVHDPQLLEALTNLQPKAQNIVIQSVGQLTRVMKNLTTGINPVFSLTRNIWRDIPTAYVNSKTTSNPFVFGKDLVGSVVSVMKNGDLYKSFKAVGGGHSSPVSSDVNLLAQSKRSILPQKGVKPLFGKVLGGLENLNNAVEAAPRLAEFKRATKNDTSYDAKMKGLFEANDVTVNFNKRGNVAKDIDAFIPYLNAALQGLDKTYRAFKENPIKVTAKAFTAMTIPTIALYVVNHKDPNYQQLSNYIKDNNFLIPNGDGTFTKIPKPRELGPAFSSSVERVLRKWNEQDPAAFDSFGKTILENFMPPTRTVLHPALVDTVANKNFMGTPIVPGDLQNLSPKYQYDAKTSELAKGLGNIFNKSPKMIDYLISSYGGGVAELGLPTLTKDATIGNTLKQKVTADPVFSNDLLSKFYDQKTKLDQAQYDYTKQGVNSSNRNDSLRKEFGAASREISKVRKSIKSLQGDSTLTPEERQKQIRILQQRINQMATQALNDSR